VGVFDAVRKQVPLENLADRAKAYGIDSYIVTQLRDGDVSTAEGSRRTARADDGPYFD